MTINYQFGEVDAHGATIRAQPAWLAAEHQAIVRDVLADGDFWGGAGPAACQEFVTQLGAQFSGDIQASQCARAKGANSRQQYGEHR
jgi:hypothetical protein